MKTFYERAIQQQESHRQFGGKIHGDSTTAAVLTEMVRQYPPDWSQAAMWTGGDGGFHVATILGADKPAVSFSHDSVAVVRTLVADLDNDGEVIETLLVEFVSSDPLNPAFFLDYVKQWQNQNYGENKVLAAEYSLGYEAMQAYLYNPADSVLTPASLSLERREKAGKAPEEGIYFCWVSDFIRTGGVCVGDPPNDSCGDREGRVSIAA